MKVEPKIRLPLAGIKSGTGISDDEDVSSSVGSQKDRWASFRCAGSAHRNT